MTRRRIARGMMLVLLAAGLALPASAPAKPRVNTDERGVAIKGYDPVAYFTEEKPVKGREEFSFAWNGARWLFASKKHRDLFAEAPEQYAPRYGGY